MPNEPSNDKEPMQYSPPPQYSQTQSPQNSSDPEETRKELDQVIRGSNETLISVSTAMQLLPTTLTLDRAKIAVTRQKWFSSSGVVSLPLGDVLNVTANVGPVFGSVKIDKRVLTNEGPYIYGPFMREKALQFATTAQGCVLALQRGIDLNALSTEELRVKLKELGKDEGVNYDGV